MAPGTGHVTADILHHVLPNSKALNSPLQACWMNGVHGVHVDQEKDPSHGIQTRLEAHVWENMLRPSVRGHESEAHSHNPFD